MDSPESPEKACQPEWPKRKPMDWWLCEEGAANNNTTISATPMRCHHTETLFKRATSLMPKVLRIPCTARITANIAIVCPEESQ